MSVLLLVLLACNGSSKESGPIDDTGTPPDDSSPPPVDADEDGFVEGEDCDDTDASIHPGADEVCDDVDNDCDSLSDEEDDGLQDGLVFYVDGDGDGHAGDTTVVVCEDPGKGYSAAPSDCDDSNASVFPGAAEMCGDGVVQDCGSNNAAAFDECNGSTTGEGLESVEITLGEQQLVKFADLDGDATLDAAIGAYHEYKPWFYERGVWIFSGPLSGELRIEDAHEILGAGTSLEIGDYDGDGQADVIAGAPTEDSPYAGAVYATTGPIAIDDFADAELTVLGDGSYELIGTTVKLLGDTTGDGWSEIVAGAAASTGSEGIYQGTVWIFDGAPGSASASDVAVAEIRGDAKWQMLGASTAVGDLTGDGVRDLVVGNGEYTRPWDHVFVGPITGSMVASDADFEVTADPMDYDIGLTTELADIDGDGSLDLLAGAVARMPGGRVYVWSGPLTKATDDSDAVARIDGTTKFLMLGGSIDVNDADDDGVTDLVVQSGIYWTGGSTGSGPAEGLTTAGFLFLGPFAGVLDETDAVLTIQETHGDRFVGIAPDMDGDGRKEIAWDTAVLTTLFVNLNLY